MEDSTKLGESAFVGAVAEALRLQNQIVELRMQLQEVDARAEHANQSALSELGFDEQTGPEEILTAQQRFLELAIERSELPNDAPVVKAARQQVRNMREQYEQMVAQEAAAFNSMNGRPL